MLLVQKKKRQSDPQAHGKLSKTEANSGIPSWAAWERDEGGEAAVSVVKQDPECGPGADGCERGKNGRSEGRLKSDKEGRRAFAAPSPKKSRRACISFNSGQIFQHSNSSALELGTVLK